MASGSESDDMTEDTQEFSPVITSAILNDIDTEIALRGRLEKTVNARLEWALRLKATLEANQTRTPDHL